MVGASKILTVSYGTFSCTLEGFDDPFSTMRSIAEYFRDLAADDRYFGAEPPTPDAEMLHQIAEREVQRRVEARVQDDGIVLRQVEPGTDEAASATVGSTAAITARVPIGSDDDVVADTRDGETASTVAEAKAETAVGDATTDDAPADESDAPISEDQGEELVAVAEEETSELEEGDDVASDIGEEDEVIAEVADEVEPTEAEATEANIDEAPEFIGEEVYAEDEEAALVAEADAPAMPVTQELPSDDDNSVAAKLSRIRAVVSGSGTVPIQDRFSGAIEDAFADAEDADYEDLTDGEPQEAADADGQDEVEAQASEPETVEEQDQETAAEHGVTEAVEDLLEMEAASEAEATADLAAFDGSDLWDETESEGDETVAEANAEKVSSEDLNTASSDEEDQELGLAARIVKLKRAAVELSAESDDTKDKADEMISSGLSDEDEAALMQELAEVEEGEDENLFDDTFETAPETEVVSEDEAETPAYDRDNDLNDEPNADQDVESAGDIDVSADDYDADDADDAMKAAIAMAAQSIDDGEEDDDVIDEIDDIDDRADEEADDSAGDPEPHIDAGQRLAGFETENAEEEAFDRILEQTNSRMDDSEGSRRRSAIAHLKAAVAATKADRLLKHMRKSDEETAEEQSQYRDDLAKVVQPRRPMTQPRDESEAHQRPAELSDKPSPLVLVSEQRVDDDDDDAEMVENDAVLPRRVNTTRELEPSDSSDEASFADFAAKMGATELPDLLEAAAAYTAFVEGNKLFSRPQIMRRIATFDTGEEFSREAGLRSFGQLLRQGKIQKLKRGQFTITEETRFNPETRMAGE